MKKIKNLKVSIADHLIFLVYFGVVVGGGLTLNEIHQSKIAQMLMSQIGDINLGEAEKVAVIRDKYKVHIAKGNAQVIITETNEVLTDKLEKEMVIKSGETIKTGSKSFVVLKFGEAEKSFLKIGEKAEVILNYKMGDGERVKSNSYNQVTDIVLKIGSVLFDIKDKYSEGDFKVKTKTATMGIRGTTFIATKDQLNSSILLVKEGAVELVNQSSYKAKIINSNQASLIYEDGVELDLEPESLSPRWSVLSKDADLIDSKAVRKIKKPQAEDDKKKTVKAVKEVKKDPYQVKMEQLLSRMNILLDNFSKETAKLKERKELLVEKNKELKLKVVKTKKNLEKKIPFIEDDLACLASKQKRCKLNNEKLLRLRGYIKILFSKRGRKSMYDNLVSYVEEQEKLIKDTEQEIIENNTKFDLTSNQLSTAQEAYAKMEKLDMQNNLKEGINIYREASKKSGFKNLIENANKVERVLESN